MLAARKNDRLLLAEAKAFRASVEPSQATAKEEPRQTPTPTPEAPDSEDVELWYGLQPVAPTLALRQDEDAVSTTSRPVVEAV